MKLEDQVCSLELAKKLKKLGAEQKSLFWWFKNKNEVFADYLYGENAPFPVRNFEETFLICSAYTAAELGALLPPEIRDLEDPEALTFDLNAYCVNHETYVDWHVAYWWNEDSRRKSSMYIEQFYADTEANARAKMLVYLLENDLLD